MILLDHFFGNKMRVKGLNIIGFSIILLRDCKKIINIVILTLSIFFYSTSQNRFSSHFFYIAHASIININEDIGGNL